MPHFYFTAEVIRTVEDTIEIKLQAEDEAEAEEKAINSINKGVDAGHQPYHFLVKSRHVRPAEDIQLELTGYMDDTPPKEYA